MRNTMRGDAREKILKTACRLFYEKGIRATGIDLIVAQSGVTKMTLYKYFPSKNDLIMAVLRHRDEEWRCWFQQTVEANVDQPGDRLLAMFDALKSWFEEDEFKGCAFLKAAAEYPETSDPIHQLVVGHMRLVGEYVVGLATQAGAKDAVALADALNLLMMGAIALAFAADQGKIIQEARRSAQILLAAHGVDSGSSPMICLMDNDPVAA
jgi:AcrR family transcriptional regulator